jgi:uncharacterized phage infection (PIP) family protein YhgE
MSRTTYLLPRAVQLRYVLIAALAFMLGTATVVTAASTSTNPIFRLGDATTAANLAAVDGSGQLHTSDATAQAKLDSANTALGTANTNLGTINTSVGATNTALSTANTSLTAANTALGGANTTLGQINTQLGKLTFDGSGNLNTAVSNLPAVTGGVTVIALATKPAIASGNAAEWTGVDVSACRSFSVAVKSTGTGSTTPPSNMHIYIQADPGFGVEVDVHERQGTPISSGPSDLGFPTQPGTSEPLYATTIGFYAYNNDGSAHDMTAAVYCQH